MPKIVLQKGTLLHQDYEEVRTVEIVLSGSVKAYNSRQSITISAGGLIGLFETPGTSYCYTYEIMEDATIYDYPYSKDQDIERMLISNAKILPNLVSGAIHCFIDACQLNQKLTSDARTMYRFIRDTYDTYLNLCPTYKSPTQYLSYMDEISDFSSDDDMPSWLLQYFNSIRTLNPELKKNLFCNTPYIALGLIMQAYMSCSTLLSLNEQIFDYLTDLSSSVITEESGDFFDLFSNLLLYASKNPFANTTPIEAAVSKMIIFMTDSKYLDMPLLHRRVQNYRNQLKEIEEAILNDDTSELVEKDAYEAIDHSMETIFDYANVSVEKRETIRNYIDAYKAMSDKNSTDDDARKLRKNITTEFYNIYESAFFASQSDKNIPTVLKMFFTYGYIDEELCGINNAIQLYDIVNNYKKDPQGNVMTLYEWLELIYKGKAEPSKNEFDMDYPAYLREQRTSGSITKEEETKYLKDSTHKVHYEISNLFTLGNRITFGRLSTFCPVLSEHNILKPLGSSSLKYNDIYDIFNEIRKVDFSCFYRDTIYSNPKLDIQKEYISVEVLPHVILMPNLGTRASLWQETADSRRDSKGRVMLSICPLESPLEMLIKICGEFRWELCKKIQGVHWNDVTDPSLTAEYCDYIQFYRKLPELSTDAKEKIKTALKKAKNNYREVFVLDYVQWIKYEGQGSPRLNRVARNIMFKYCPFPKELREALGVNPLYGEILERFNIKRQQRIHSLDLVIQKITKKGASVPEEFTKQREYILS